METQTHRKFLVFYSPVTILVVKQFVSTTVQRIHIYPAQGDKLQK